MLGRICKVFGLASLVLDLITPFRDVQGSQSTVELDLLVRGLLAEKPRDLQRIVTGVDQQAGSCNAARSLLDNHMSLKYWQAPVLMACYLTAELKCCLVSLWQRDTLQSVCRQRHGKACAA